MLNEDYVMHFAKVVFVAVATAMSGMGLSGALVPGWNSLSGDSAIPLPENTKAWLEAPGKFAMEADLSTPKLWRAGWDFRLPMDLRRQIGVTFDFYCSDVSQFTGFNIYFRSGAGWYSASFSPSENAKWHRVTVKKSAFAKTEGKVAGWGKISAMRIGCWSGGKSKVRFGLANLSYIDYSGPVVGVVRADSCVADPKFKAEHDSLASFAAATASALEFAGVNVVEISDIELDADTLQGMKLLVFPYNPRLPKGKGGVVADFVEKGGKIFACHSQDEAVRKALGLSAERYRNRNWRSSSETPTKEKNGFYLSHVWRYDANDSIRQAYDLLSQVDPSWKAFLDEAKAKAEEEAKKDAQWIAAQPSKEGEWRAFWCHSACGLKGRDWDWAIRFLKENGFNAIIPNLSSAGVAYYRSDVLPVDKSVQVEGDAFDECMAACRKYGVECHVWKVCWRMRLGSDKSFAKKMAEEGRTQISFDGGKRDEWLCPSHPENLKMETQAFVELAKKGPTGIHFDYIRYPSSAYCFCGGCRERFEKRIGRVVENWPKDIRSDAALSAEWKKFRCSNITALVKGVSDRVRKDFPRVQISAAVFHNPETDPGEIGQDWVNWGKAGYLRPSV